jgi:hypothetical protein
VAHTGPARDRARRWSLFVLAALLACGPRVTIHAERSRIVTFPRYQTYRWLSVAAPARSARDTAASLLDWRIRNAVDRGLAAKGYRRTDAAATLLLDYDVRPRAEDATFQDFFRERRLENGGEPFASRYPEEGTLVVHLVDARTGELAYRASASAVIREDADGDDVDAAIARMLTDLPPAGGS